MRFLPSWLLRVVPRRPMHGLFASDAQSYPQMERPHVIFVTAAAVSPQQQHSVALTGPLPGGRRRLGIMCRTFFGSWFAAVVLMLAGLLLPCLVIAQSGQRDDQNRRDHAVSREEAISNQNQPDVESGKYATVLRGLLSHTVPEIGVADLEVMKGAVLLDAREAEEFAVSRLAGARYAGYDHFDLNMLGDLDRNQTVVVYCSVGYRSEKIAEKLLEAGFSQVYNLYGGIFEWVNAGKPVVDASGKPTDRVHAYNRTWGLFLQKGEKVY